jgi:hypothetical protein
VLHDAANADAASAEWSDDLECRVPAEAVDVMQARRGPNGGRESA